MKLNKIFSVLAIAGAMCTVTSCNDFLDRAPLDKVTPNNYLNNDAQLAAYAINLYNFPSKGGWGLGSVIRGDDNTDNMAASKANEDLWVPERWLTSMNGGISFSRIRSVNYFLEDVLPKYESGRITGSKNKIEQYIGEIYFLRAMEYFDNLRTYGDFPILTKVLPDIKDVLIDNSKRQPRNEVARFILSDLDKAIELLSNDKALTGNKVRISKNAAYLLKSRVALYEGTWLTYHANTPRVPNGPEWPGKKLHPDYQYPAGSIEEEAKFFLNEALTASEEIISIPLQDQGQGLRNPINDQFQGWNSYYDMFCDDNMGKYDEVILWREYSLTYNVKHGTSEYLRKGGNLGYTKGYMDSFLMQDGKPIYAATNGEYKGDATLEKQKENRDSRLQLFMTSEDDSFAVASSSNPNIEVTKFGQRFQFPYILEQIEVRVPTGYTPRKNLSLDPRYLTKGGGLIEASGSIVFRAVEGYLNYLEASYMLNNGLTAKAKSVWGQIRERANMPANSFEVTIANTDLTKEAEGDWAVYSAGQMVDPTLFNIRRERRSEFIADGMRKADLYRWCALNQVRNYVIKGFNLWDENYTKYDVENKDEEGNVIGTKSALVEPGTPGKTANISSKSDPKAEGKYVLPYRIIKENNELYEGYSWRQAKYLSPIPIRHMQLASPTGDANNSNFYQNPDWPTVGDSPALKSNDVLDN